MKPIISPWLLYLIDLIYNLKDMLCVISLLCTAFPSKDTMYKMLMLENVTTDNIQVVGKTNKYVVDYIVDQIDKEENEK